APVVRGRHITDLHYAFLVERGAAAAGEGGGPLRRAFLAASLAMLPPAEQRLVEFLLLLPLAALVVCLFSNVLGLACFVSFAPALLGLAFRDLHSMPGLLVFVAVVLAGWLLRRALDRYHLLQVPRSAVLLSLVVLLLAGAVVAANLAGVAATKYVSL